MTDRNNGEILRLEIKKRMNGMLKIKELREQVLRKLKEYVRVNVNHDRRERHHQIKPTHFHHHSLVHVTMCGNVQHYTSLIQHI